MANSQFEGLSASDIVEGTDCFDELKAEIRRLHKLRQELVDLEQHLRTEIKDIGDGLDLSFSQMLDIERYLNV